MAAQVQDDNKFTGARLPQDSISPKHYDLYLKPDFTNFTYEGTVNILYEKARNDKEITVNLKEVIITEGKIGQNLLKKVTYSKTSETATLEFEAPLEKEGKIELKFNGILNDKMKGFYRTSFEIDGQTIIAASTQFEATDARTCFPCWDEPSFKATFSVTLCFNRWCKVGDNKKVEMIGLSNTPILNETGDELLTISYKPTPMMSTYLLAFVIGPFEYVEANDGKRPIRVYTRPGKKEQGKFPLEVACKSLAYYEDYFCIEYPLEKMDLIAIPDFNMGAMENWGLITYRETCLLVDEANTSTIRKQYVALVVAHELAHQWFGNLVTMDWWSDLWLNEGFATFMEYLCIESIFPHYDIWSQFVADTYCTALDLDALHNSHPIEVPVNNASEINEIFDSISYNKGSAVIKMLYEYIGDKCFRIGMRDYLNKFNLKNATTRDLWHCLEVASGKPIREVMSAWTMQKGFPWLSISTLQEGADLKLTIIQEKFTSDGKLPENEMNTLWLIPITTMNGSDPMTSSEISLIKDKTNEITIRNVGDNWVKLNPGTVGLYRTAYPEAMFKKLSEAILEQKLPPLDRLGFQSDYFALCQAGKVDTVSLLKLLNAYKNETNYTVWNSIDQCIGKLSALLSHTNYKDRFNEFGRDLYSGIFEKLTWSTKESDSYTDPMLRALVINRLVSFKHQAIIDEAKRRFDLHVLGTQSIPADLRAAVYKSIAMYQDDSSYNQLFELYKASDLQEEKNRIVSALGFGNSLERLKRVIDFILSDLVRIQDKPFSLCSIGLTNSDMTFNFLKEHKDMLRDKYQGVSISAVVKNCIRNFASDDKLKEIEQFFNENEFSCKRTIQQCLETIRINASWLTRDGEIIRDFLSSKM